MKLRRVISLFLLVGVVFLLVTSVILYVTPQGRVAYWTGWRLLGLTKTDWTNLHINLGLMLLIAAGLHTYYNWRSITAYLRNRAGRPAVFSGEFSLALAVTAVTIVATQLNIPPFQWVLDLNESAKDVASARYGEPPYGHAELSTLQTFARRLDLGLPQVLERLEAAGYVVEGPQVTLEEIAAANAVTPQQLYEVMQERAEDGKELGRHALPKIPPPGTGKQRLIDICGQYDLDVEIVMQQLASRGIRGTAEQTLQELASGHDTTPDEIYEVIRVAVSP